MTRGKMCNKTEIYPFFFVEISLTEEPSLFWKVSASISLGRDALYPDLEYGNDTT